MASTALVPLSLSQAQPSEKKPVDPAKRLPPAWLNHIYSFVIDTDQPYQPISKAWHTAMKFCAKQFLNAWRWNPVLVPYVLKPAEIAPGFQPNHAHLRKVVRFVQTEITGRHERTKGIVVHPQNVIRVLEADEHLSKIQFFWAIRNPERTGPEEIAQAISKEAEAFLQKSDTDWQEPTKIDTWVSEGLGHLQLAQLKSLNLAGLHFTALPSPMLASCSALEKLYLDSRHYGFGLYRPPVHNHLYFLPSTLFQLTNLKVLILGGNHLSVLSSDIQNLRNLTILGLSSNNFENLPEEIGALRNLTTLNLNDNNLQNLPRSTVHLENLQDLTCNDNALVSLPDGMERFSRIRTLSFAKNRLAAVPLEFLDRPRFEDEFDRNPLNRLPCTIRAKRAASRLINKVERSITHPSRRTREVVQILGLVACLIVMTYGQFNNMTWEALGKR